MLSTEDAIESFLIRYTLHTRDTYGTTLRLLSEWFEARGKSMLAATRPELEMFSHYLANERDNGPATINHRVGVIKSFYELMAYDEVIRKSPAVYLTKPREPMKTSTTQYLTRSEMAMLLTEAKKNPYDEALISALALLALRISEALSLRVEDLTWEGGYRMVKIYGKGSKPAKAPLPVPVTHAFDAIIGDRKNGALLLRKPGRKDYDLLPHSYKSAYGSVARLIEAIGIKKHITPHSLRHSYITAALNAGVPLRDVQKAARHSDPRMTLYYDRSGDQWEKHANHYVTAFVAGAM